MPSPVFTIYALVVAVLVLRHDYMQPNPTAGVIACLGVLVCGFLTKRVATVPRIDISWGASALLFVAFVAASSILGGDAALYLGVASVAPGAHLLASRWPKLRARTAQSLLASLMLVAAYPITVAMETFAITRPVFPLIAKATTLPLRFFFEQVESVDGIVIVQKMTKSFECVASLESTALESIGFLSIGAIVAAILDKRKWAASLIAISAPIAVIVRFAACELIHAEFESPFIFIDTASIAISLAPIALFYAVIYERLDLVRDRPPVTVSVGAPRAALLVGIPIAVAAVVVGFFSAAHDPGDKKTARVVINERNSDWAWTSIPLDRDNYGVLSMYNFRSLADWLSTYYKVARNTDPIGDRTLSECDVLILKTPTASYSSEEIDAIERYVAAGGGVIVVGDHTNVFGTSGYANDVLARFGMRLNYDATYELKAGGPSRFRPREIGAHPIVAGIESIEFASSCTVSCDQPTESAIDGYGLRTCAADYAASNFFPSTERVLAHPHQFGRFDQLATRTFGRGRVAVFTDSTIFSNFYLFLEGRAEMALMLVEWTGRGSHWSIDRRTCATAAWGLLLVGVAGILAAKKLRALALLGASTVLGFAIGVTVGRAFDATHYAPPTAHAPMTEIRFDLSHSPELEATMQYFPIYPTQISTVGWSTFYLWSQRAGLRPKVEHRLESCLEDNGVCVLVNPTVGFRQGEIERMDRFMNEGGSICLLLSFDSPFAAVRPLLRHFDLSLEYRAGDVVEATVDGKPLAKVDRPVYIKGGETMITGIDGLAIAARKRVGRGELVVYGAARSLSDKNLGYYKSVPTAEERCRADIAFLLFDEVVRKSE